MSKFLGKIFEPLFQLFVFLLPTQLGYHFWPEWSYVFGIRSDYLSPTIYLTDLLFLVLLFLFFKNEKGPHPIKRLGKYLIAFGAIGLTNTLFSVNPYASVLRWLKALEVVALGLVVVKTGGLDIKNWILKPLALSTIFFCSIGVLQFISGRTVGGVLYFLGERDFNLSTPGIALTSFFGKVYLRAYSTFSHPNSFAGFLAVSLVLLFFLRFRNLFWERVRRVAVVFGAIGLMISASAGAWIFVSIVLLAMPFIVRGKGGFSRVSTVILFTAILVSMLAPIISSLSLKDMPPFSESINKRLILSEQAGIMISRRPILGVGLNGFINENTKISGYPGVSWWLQPVHNIFLLLFAEGGIFVLVLFSAVFYLALKKVCLGKNITLVSAILVIILTGMVDHYWVTLQQNQLLLGLVLGLSFRETPA